MHVSGEKSAAVLSITHDKNSRGPPFKYDGGERAIAELKRDRLLREAGYEVIHFTWQELFSDPVRVAGRIRAAFERAIRLSR